MTNNKTVPLSPSQLHPKVESYREQHDIQQHKEQFHLHLLQADQDREGNNEGGENEEEEDIGFEMMI